MNCCPCSVLFQWVTNLFNWNRKLAKGELLIVKSKHWQDLPRKGTSPGCDFWKATSAAYYTSRCCLKEKFKNNTKKTPNEITELWEWSTLLLKQIFSDTRQPNSIRNEEVAPLNSFGFWSATLRLPSCKYLCQQFAIFSQDSFPKALLKGKRSKNVIFLVAMSSITLAWKMKIRC